MVFTPEFSFFRLNAPHTTKTAHVCACGKSVKVICILNMIIRLLLLFQFKLYYMWCVCVFVLATRLIVTSYSLEKPICTCAIIVAADLVHSHCLVASCRRCLQFNKLHMHATHSINFKAKRIILLCSFRSCTVHYHTL